MSILLESKELSKTFVVSNNQENHILKNVNLTIEKGEFVSVMGPSGSGKSTLLYNISGMDRMTSGSVVLNGQEISALTEQELADVRLEKMGFIFQHIHLLKNLNIIDNIVLSAYMNNSTSRAQVNERARQLMKRTGIAELANNDITQASGGQLQRVAICRALINKPEIVFGDEPTGALNSKSASEIMDILADINDEGTTILLVTHDVKVAAKSERILFMLDGNIVAEQRLGKYSRTGEDIKARENKLAHWLMEMGF
ncbi:ABC transporter ATP-binding protein [Paenibacillus sp. SC116]|uniref:ABC transporter ATP-binding protein n=1 Tax=Paenibacillus sp. SC116 TaxID=2968986 RepID=UPI00215AC382|nr:ABC transporter ATP-binding protein [Paenibacillus sp. SC116]MCR8844301.1 ABC transporter ATP-binding protein [Paenibacillus sp. SC116]